LDGRVDLDIGEGTALLYDPAGPGWLLFQRPVRILQARRPEEVRGLLRTVERSVDGEGLSAAGFLAYEAAPAFDPACAVRPAGDFPLAWFGLYPTCRPAALPILPPGPLRSVAWQATVSRQAYATAIGRVRGWIAAGDTYQVNYTYRLRAHFAGDPRGLFAAMIRAQGPHYGAYLHTGDWIICSASPELFFRLERDALLCRPMKGTAPRGLWQAHDLEQAAGLRRSEKNRAENVMIVDMVRNDMGRIAEPGSVEVPRLFDVEKYPTLWQMTSTVRCRTRAGIPEIFGALFPAASITGAPKVRTMQIIAELEPWPRRIYTGAIGFLAPQRRAQFNVAIRTVLVDPRRQLAEYGTGGGIVWDSAEDAEFEECATKARILTEAVPEFALLETMAWTPSEGYLWLDRHLSRLMESAAYFSRPLDPERVRRTLASLAHGLPPRPHRVRLLVPPHGEPVAESQPLTQGRNPYRIRLARRPVHSQDSFLYHKTTHRRVYERALAASPGEDDVLLWNEKGEITESCIANVAVERDGELLTPPVRCGLLPGIYRSLLLDQGRIKEAILRVEDLQATSRIFLMNSVRGMWEAAFGSGG